MTCYRGSKYFSVKYRKSIHHRMSFRVVQTPTLVIWRLHLLCKWFLIGANLFYTPTSVEHRETVQVPAVPLTMTLQQLEKSIVEFSVVLRGLLIHSCEETCNKGKEEPSRSCNPGPHVKIAEAPSSGKAGCPNNRGSTRGTIELQEHAALVRWSLGLQ
jgi:hypothetical protein